MLEGLGYAVLDAGHPLEAIRTAERHDGPIPLLITDLVMPQINGRVLAKKLTAARPEMKVLYTSGYSSVACVSRANSNQDVPFSRSLLHGKCWQKEYGSFSMRKCPDSSALRPRKGCRVDQEALTLLVSGYPGVQSGIAAIPLEADEIVVKPIEAGRLAEFVREKMVSRKPTLRSRYGSRNNCPVDSVADFESDGVRLEHDVLKREEAVRLDPTGLLNSVSSCSRRTP